MLLKKHGLPVFDGIYLGKVSFWWRHGYPSKYLKLLGEKSINFLIVRDLDDWLISMYNTPYYLKLERSQSFGEFLITKQKLSDEKDVPINIRNNKVLNHTDENKTIFEIRYNKLRSFLDYFKNNKDVVIVRLKYLQDEQNCIHFMQEVAKKYNLYISEFNGCINAHTKTQELGVKNRTYSTKIGPLERGIINMYKNKELEDYVNNLTFEMS